jgi:hypothetical protein
MEPTDAQIMARVIDVGAAHLKVRGPAAEEVRPVRLTLWGAIRRGLNKPRT